MNTTTPLSHRQDMTTTILFNNKPYEVIGNADLSQLPNLAVTTESITHVKGPRGATGSITVLKNGSKHLQFFSRGGRSRIENAI